MVFGIEIETKSKQGVASWQPGMFLQEPKPYHVSFYSCSASSFFVVLFVLFVFCFCITVLCPAASNSLASDVYAALGSPKHLHAVHQGQDQARLNVPYVNSISNFSKHVPNPLHPIYG